MQVIFMATPKFLRKQSPFVYLTRKYTLVSNYKKLGWFTAFLKRVCNEQNVLILKNLCATEEFHK